MLIIFDLDYTLFDTKKFNASLAKALEISLKMFNNDYDKYFVKTKTNYSLKKHLSILRRQSGVDYSKIKKNLADMWRNVGKFLFINVENLLIKLKKEKNYLVLATYGDDDWQNQKIKKLKIKKYFNDIIIADNEKHFHLEKFKSEKNILIVNDKADECQKIKSILPQAKILLVKSRYSNNIKHNFNTISNKSLKRYL